MRLLLQLFLLPKISWWKLVAIASCKINHNYVCHHLLCNLALFLDNILKLSVFYSICNWNRQGLIQKFLVQKFFYQKFIFYREIWYTIPSIWFGCLRHHAPTQMRGALLCQRWDTLAPLANLLDQPMESHEKRFYSLIKHYKEACIWKCNFQNCNLARL